MWLFRDASRQEPVALRRYPTRAEPLVLEVAVPEPVVPTRPRWRRRAATTLAFTAFFCAGGALSAGAGNELAHVDAGSTDAAVSVDPTTTDATLPAESTTDTTATDTTATDTTTTDMTTSTTTAEVTTTDAAVTTPADTTVAPVEEVDPSDATPSVAPVSPAVTVAEPTAPAPVAAVAPVAAPAKQAHKTTPVVVQSAPGAVQPAALPFPVIAFNPQAWLVDHPGTPAGDAVVAIAKRYLGVPYVWGGNKPTTGFDCSGLTQFVYAQLGVWLPHYAAAQFLAYPRLDPTQLQPGDLVFFEPKADGPGHVAIYAGGDTIIEAPHTGALVRVGSMSGAAAALGFLGAVRPSAGVTVSTPPPVRTLASVRLKAEPGNWLALSR